jgi:hypothetical protein
MQKFDLATAGTIYETSCSNRTTCNGLANRHRNILKLFKKITENVQDINM